MKRSVSTDSETAGANQIVRGMIDRKIREIGAQATPPPSSAAGESPFLSTKEVQKIFGVSRQTINDWRKSGLLPSIKIKSRRYFIRDEVQALQQKWKSPGDQ